jgi:hypothetical protein
VKETDEESAERKKRNAESLKEHLEVLALLAKLNSAMLLFGIDHPIVLRIKDRLESYRK